MERGAPGLGVAVDDREVDLPLVRIEVEEQLVHLIHDLQHPRVRPVHLVDHENHRQMRLERLAQHEPRLRQRTLGSVDEQEHAVHHRQPALDLSPEVRVPGGVDDVQLDVAVAQRGVLGEDRYSLLALQIHRVEHPRGHVLADAEGARLPQHRVHQRGLAVVDVRDDRHVPYVISGLEHSPIRLAAYPRRPRPRDHSYTKAGQRRRVTLGGGDRLLERGGEPPDLLLFDRQRG